MQQCPEVFQLYQQTKKLSSASAEYDRLLKGLKKKVCNSVEKKVCCQQVSRKISGAIGPTDPNEFPFMVRLTIRGADGLQAHCGASLIASKYLASAYHCFYNANPDIQFERDCRQPGSCYATIAEHDISRTDLGEHDIDIKEVFRPPGRDQEDLAIVELKTAVILNKRVKLVPISEERPKPGDVMMTLGWGLAFQGGQPNELLKAQLNVSDVDIQGGLDYTEVGSNRIGIPVDTCQGDSGGPLLGWRQNEWHLFSTLQGGGYNCLTDRTRGDGVWNSVAGNFNWVQQLISERSEKIENSNKPLQTVLTSLYDALWVSTNSLVISSTASASEYVGNVLGEFVKEGFSGGKPFFRQKDTVGKRTEFFLYYNNSNSCESWLVGNTLGPCSGVLSSDIGKSITYPPVCGWKYWNDGWQDNDPTLSFSHVVLNSGNLIPCSEVLVNASYPAVRIQQPSIGIYRPSGEWMEGRPVYVKSAGQESRYLLVAEHNCFKVFFLLRTLQLIDGICLGANSSEMHNKVGS